MRPGDPRFQQHDDDEGGQLCQGCLVPAEALLILLALALALGGACLL